MIAHLPRMAEMLRRQKACDDQFPPVLPVAHARFQRLEDSRDSSIIRFATLQWIALIYFQKFAIVEGSVAIGVPMLVLCFGALYLIFIGRMRFAGNALAAYLLFIGLAGLSQLPVLATASMPSFAFLVVLYALMLIRVDVSEEVHARIQRRFLDLMLLPAGVVIFQFVWQKALNVGNPLSMDALFPSSILMPGFIYEAPQVWNEPFMRPNGFFFLETSFASAFLASAAILAYSRNAGRIRVAFFVLATLATAGGTGATMLGLAFSFLVVQYASRRANPITAFALIAAFAIVCAGLGMWGMQHASAFDRIAELDKAGSSGSGRLMLPAQKLIATFLDVPALFGGAGAGSTVNKDSGSAWPMLKLMEEYGLIPTVAFMIYFAATFSASRYQIFTMTWGLTFLFTGGYLLNPVFLELGLMLSIRFRFGHDQSLLTERRPCESAAIC